MRPGDASTRMAAASVELLNHIVKKRRTRCYRFGLIMSPEDPKPIKRTKKRLKEKSFLNIFRSKKRNRDQKRF